MRTAPPASRDWLAGVMVAEVAVKSGPAKVLDLQWGLVGNRFRQKKEAAWSHFPLPCRDSPTNHGFVV